MSSVDRLHSFPDYCIGKDLLANSQTVAGYLDTLDSQSRNSEAKRKYISPAEEDRSIAYFGAGGEFLAHCYFEYFYKEYNLHEICSVDGRGMSKRDKGWDIEAKTLEERKHRKIVNAKMDSLVYIQVKTMTDPKYIHKINDGSRIMNFVGASAMDAISREQGHSARFVLWTTGGGIDRILDDNTCKRIEVISRNEIASYIDDNTRFWIHVKARFGIDSTKIV